MGNKKKHRKKLNTEEQTHEESTESQETEEIMVERPAEKRSYEDDDSDNQDKPKRKKKKKQQVTTETGDKKGKKSIRQMKREKFAQRQAEAQFVAKDQLKSQCLSYLSQWKHDRQNWKFMKAKQGWLFKNKFVASLLPDSSWPVFLEYFEAAKGNIKNLLLEDANKVIKQMDDWTESQSQENVPTNDEATDQTNEKEIVHNKPDDTAYKRARDLIQCLQE